MEKHFTKEEIQQIKNHTNLILFNSKLGNIENLQIANILIERLKDVKITCDLS